MNRTDEGTNETKLRTTECFAKRFQILLPMLTELFNFYSPWNHQKNVF